MTIKITPRLALVIIASMFMLPLAVAWLMYSGIIDYSPVETRNLGSLVQPPVPVSLESLVVTGEETLPLEDLREHWVVLYALPDPCRQDCLEDAAALRQVHRAAGRNQSRIRIVLLGKSATPSLLDIYPSFHLAVEAGAQLTGELNTVARTNNAPVAGSLYLIDPLGNIMMFYAAGFDPNDLKKDLKRLLTWSKLDEH